MRKGRPGPSRNDWSKREREIDKWAAKQEKKIYKGTEKQERRSAPRKPSFHSTDFFLYFFATLRSKKKLRRKKIFTFITKCMFQYKPDFEFFHLNI